MLQDEVLTLICPLTDNAPLKERLVDASMNMFTTYQGIPFLDIIHGMDTGIKVLHDDQDLNPRKEVCCEELVNCLFHFLSVVATAGALQVFCPEPTGIFQCIPNVFLPSSRKVINITEDSIVIQVTDIPLQPLFHQIEA